jgi:hypothetical protein
MNLSVRKRWGTAKARCGLESRNSIAVEIRHLATLRFFFAKNLDDEYNRDVSPTTKSAPLMTFAQVCFGLAMMTTTRRRTKLKRYHHNVPTIPKVIRGLMPAYVNPTKSIEIGKSITIMYSRL